MSDDGMHSAVRTCASCGGAIFPPGVVVGYAGKFCGCGQAGLTKPLHTESWPPNNRSTASYVQEGLNYYTHRDREGLTKLLVFLTNLAQANSKGSP